MGTHVINLNGRAGTILWALIAGLTLFTVGFATSGWRVRHNHHIGLWEACTCGGESWMHDEEWFKATQAMEAIGLIGLLLTFVFFLCYVFISVFNKDALIVLVVVMALLSVVFMTLGFVIFGIKTDHQSYSFVMAVLGAAATLVAGVLAIMQLRHSR